GAAFIGQDQPAWCAPEQLQPQPQLKSFHLMADRGLGDRQFHPGAGEGEMARCRFESPERAKRYGRNVERSIRKTMGGHERMSFASLVFLTAMWDSRNARDIAMNNFHRRGFVLAGLGLAAAGLPARAAETDARFRALEAKLGGRAGLMAL